MEMIRLKDRQPLKANSGCSMQPETPAYGGVLRLVPNQICILVYI